MNARVRTRVPGVLLWVVAAGCANELPPPGALPDDDPPRVERIEPAPDSVVEDFDGRVRIHFNEPIQVPGDLGRRLGVSPLERYEVTNGFRDIRLRPQGGWRDSVVYCFELPEGISDLMRNRTEARTGFCFSTGIPLADTRVRGTVIDAVTGQPQNQATVLFLAPPDSTPYGAIAEADGTFELRALPPGGWEAWGFLDRNRNFRVDRALEPYDSARVTVREGGPVTLEFRVIEPDSTPPRLLRIEAVDGLTLRLEFDDPLVRNPPAEPTVIVTDTADTRTFGVRAVRIGEPATVRFPPEPGDTVSAGPEPADTTGAAPPAAEALPSRFASVRLRDPIASGLYRVRASGFVNLRRLAGGGDTTFVAEVASTAADSAAAADSVATVPDTVGLPPDTVGLPPDTVSPRRSPAGRPGKRR